MPSFWSRFNLELGDLWTGSISHSEIIKSFYYLSAKNSKHVSIYKTHGQPKTLLMAPRYQWATVVIDDIRMEWIHLDVLFKTSTSQKVDNTRSHHQFSRNCVRGRYEKTDLPCNVQTLNGCQQSLSRPHVIKKIRKLYHRLVYGTQKLKLRAYSNDTEHEPQHRTDGRTDERTARLPTWFRRLDRNGVNILDSVSVYECARFYVKCTCKHQKQMKNMKHVFH
jgi:hypothetical protein